MDDRVDVVTIYHGERKAERLHAIWAVQNPEIFAKLSPAEVTGLTEMFTEKGWAAKSYTGKASGARKELETRFKKLFPNGNFNDFLAKAERKLCCIGKSCSKCVNLCGFASSRTAEVTHQLMDGEARASVEVSEDGRALIRAFEAASASDMVQELGHGFRRTLSMSDRSVVEKWAGVKDGDWTEAAEEKFAKAFQRYIDGKPAIATKGVRGIFERLKDYVVSMMGWYSTKSDLSPAMQDVFDRISGGKKVAKREAVAKPKAKEAKKTKDIDVLYSRADATGDEVVDVALDDVFGSDHPGLRDKLKTWWRDYSFKTSVLDGLNPILEAFGGVDENNRVYKLFRMLKGIHASVEGMMVHGKLVLNKDGVLTVLTKNKGYAQLMKKHGNHLRDSLRWAAAKRSLEAHEASANIREKIKTLKAEGKTAEARNLQKKSKDIIDFTKMEELLTIEEATNILEQYGERPEGYDLSYQELFDLHDEFHQSVLDIAVNSGVISKEQREQWRDFTYVPFYRVFEDADSKAEFFENPKAGIHIANKLSKKLKGSKRKINEPLENAIANWAYLIQESMRNRATAEAYFTAQHMKYHFNSTVMEDIDPSEIEAIKIDKGVISYKTKGGDNNVMSFLVNGERKYFQVHDTSLFNALGSINKQGFGKLFNLFFGTPKKVLTYTATFGPAFRVANLLRDTLHTWMITPGANFKPFLDSFHGFVRAWNQDA
ncbi:MAG: hypothetical protein ACXABY_30780, partial [Candidatus Thorarchaeota archaeon]